VVAVVKALASRGLSFRGHDEKFGSLHNGNHLMSLLIAEFDPFLAEHISRYGNVGSDQTSYLSSTICEEFIKLMADKVTCVIINEITLAKYFSIIVDSTPDISHIAQLTFLSFDMFRKMVVQKKDLLNLFQLLVIKCRIYQMLSRRL